MLTALLFIISFTNNEEFRTKLLMAPIAFARILYYGSLNKETSTGIADRNFSYKYYE